MDGQGLIIGAGIIGSAIAAELSARGVRNLHVVDADLEGPLSSTERNAGGVRELWQQKINSDLSAATISLLEKIPETTGFQQTGYLWLFGKDQTEKGETLFKEAVARKLSYEKLSLLEIQKRYPFLDQLDDVAFALLGKRDGIINSNALKMYFRESAKKKGVMFHSGRIALELHEKNSAVEVGFSAPLNEGQAENFLRKPEGLAVTEKGHFDFVVLAGGAWSAWLLGQLVENPMIRPVRRQICSFKSETFDFTPYGMVVDTSGVYFHPEGGGLLSGLVLKEEPSGYRFDYDADFFETHIWPNLFKRSSHFERLKFQTGWAGLYSYTDDTTGILGRLPGYKMLFEAHSFTGRGVMQSQGAALMTADLILSAKDSVLSRERFKKPRTEWLFEGLHI